MPNWAYTAVCFKGKVEDIQRLNDDIIKATEYERENNYKYINLWHFFSLSGFDVKSYLNRRHSRSLGIPNFRGSIREPRIEIKEDYAYLFPYIETAWDMDYNILYLIAAHYNVEFSAYSEEPSNGYYEKCRNSELDIYDYDIAISPDWEELEILEEETNIYFDPTLAGKRNEPEIIETIEYLNKNNVEHETYEIPENLDGLNVYGVYYGPPVPGVTYDDININVNDNV
jgi:hypothetical protein